MHYQNLMSYLKHIILPLILAILALPARAQADNDALGTDFWFTFVNNDNNIAIKGNVIIVAPQGAFVHVETADHAFSQYCNIPRGGIDTVAIPAIITRMNIDTCSVITPIHNGVHLTSNAPVFAYVDDSYVVGRPGACRLRPTAKLGTHYVASTPPVNSMVRVVATEDSTMVAVDLTAQLTLSPYYPNITYTFNLNQGDVLSFLSGGDLSGSRIRSTNGKPISVICGSPASYVPNPYMFADLLIEHLAAPWPRTAHYLLPRRPNERYMCKVTDLGEGAHLHFNRTGDSVVLAPYQSYDYYVDSNASLDLRDITITDGSAQVFYFMCSHTYNHMGRGDSDMALLTPLVPSGASTLKFSTFDLCNRHLTNFYLQLEGYYPPVDSAHLFRLDGSPLSPILTVDGDDTTIFYARLPLSWGSHTLQTPEGMRLNAMVIGEQTWGGITVQLPLNNRTNIVDITANGEVCQQLYETCPGNTIDFRATALYGYDSVRWTLDDTITARGSIYHYVMDTAQHLLRCKVFYTTLLGTHSTLERRISLIPATGELRSDTIASCAPVVYHDSLIAATGTYQWRHPSPDGCDTVVQLVFTLLPTKADTSAADICPGTTYRWHGYTLRSPGTYTDTLATSLGCDSLVTLQLRHLPAPISVIRLSDEEIYDPATVVTVSDASLGATSRSWWVDQQWWGTDSLFYYQLPQGQGQGHFRLVTANDYGCSDTTEATLRVGQHHLYAPNIIILGDPDNGTFRFATRGITELQVTLFDRMGRQLLTFDGLRDAWDGTLPHATLRQGSYVWKARFRTLTTNAYQTATGTVTVVK